MLPFPHGPRSVLSQQRKGWDSCCKPSQDAHSHAAEMPALLLSAPSTAGRGSSPAPCCPSGRRFPAPPLIATQRPPCHQPPLLLSRASSKALGNQAHLCPTALLLISFKEVTKIIRALSEAVVTTGAHRTSAAWCGSPSVRSSQHRFAAEACALRVALPWQHFLCFD